MITPNEVINKIHLIYKTWGKIFYHYLSNRVKYSIDEIKAIKNTSDICTYAVYIDSFQVLDGDNTRIVFEEFENIRQNEVLDYLRGSSQRKSYFGSLYGWK